MQNPIFLKLTNRLFAAPKSGKALTNATDCGKQPNARNALLQCNQFLGGFVQHPATESGSEPQMRHSTSLLALNTKVPLRPRRYSRSSSRRLTASCASE